MPVSECLAGIFAFTPVVLAIGASLPALRAAAPQGTSRRQDLF